MDWTQQQDQALQRVSHWMRDGDRPYFYLGGFAGTGKTTLARSLADEAKGIVLFAAYTGKAAHVMRQKGCPATTLHSLLYVVSRVGKERLLALQEELRVKTDADPGFPASLEGQQMAHQIREEQAAVGRMCFHLNLDSAVKSASLVVVDECSMVDQRLGEDLLSFGVPVLALGDPAQLPPVYGAGYFTSGAPDFFLTEIQRQAADNPIIRLATMVRGGELPPAGAYGESRVMRPGEFRKEEMDLGSQVIVGRNATRRRANTFLRERRGYQGHLPQLGDRLVCLKNDHEEGLLNGGMWETLAAGLPEEGVLSLTARGLDDDSVVTCECHEAPFKGEDVPRWADEDVQSFDYGYCLTAHKAQGSEFPDVTVVDEGACFRQERWRWLYTAITRAKDRVTVALT